MTVSVSFQAMGNGVQRKKKRRTEKTIYCLSSIQFLFFKSLYVKNQFPYKSVDNEHNIIAADCFDANKFMFMRGLNLFAIKLLLTLAKITT